MPSPPAVSQLSLLATLASLPSSVPQLLHMLFPLPGKLFLSHPSGRPHASPAHSAFLSFSQSIKCFHQPHCLRVSADLPLSHALSAQHGSIITLGYTFQGVIPCVPSTFFTRLGVMR